MYFDKSPIKQYENPLSLVIAFKNNITEKRMVFPSDNFVSSTNNYQNLLIKVWNDWVQENTYEKVDGWMQTY